MYRDRVRTYQQLVGRSDFPVVCVDPLTLGKRHFEAGMEGANVFLGVGTARDVHAVKCHRGSVCCESPEGTLKGNAARYEGAHEVLSLTAQLVIGGEEQIMRDICPVVEDFEMRQEREVEAFSRRRKGSEAEELGGHIESETRPPHAAVVAQDAGSLK